MKQLTTKSGAVYTIDLEAKTWKCDRPNDGILRSTEGTWLDIAWEVGEPLSLLCPPFVEKAVGRLIVTTPVMEVADV